VIKHRAMKNDRGCGNTAPGLLNLDTRFSFKVQPLHSGRRNSDIPCRESSVGPQIRSVCDEDCVRAWYWILAVHFRCDHFILTI